MEGAALAIAVLIIVGFVVFIMWAKSATGQKSLRNTLGDPGKHRMRATKRRTTSSASAAKTNKTGKPSTR